MARPRDQVVSLRAEGLTPDTRYLYQIETSEGRSEVGRFRTVRDGALDFSVAFASCARTGSRSAVFTTIARLEPRLFIHLGDFHYEDINRDEPQRFRQAYDRVLTSPTQAAMLRVVPVVYTWDDHDFGANNSDRTSPSRAAAQSVYRELVPHYPLPSGASGAIHQAFSIGRVRFLVTDSRSERSPDRERDTGSKTLLGDTQRRWFESELEVAAKTAALVVWVNTVPWITRVESASSNDGWQPYARERAEIASLIARLGLDRRLVMLSGDGHMVAIDDGRNSNYAGARLGAPSFFVMHAAPLDQNANIEGGPYSHGTSRVNGQFGLMDVRDDGTSLAVTLTGRAVDGSVIRGMELALDCGAAECQVRPRR